MYRAYSGTQAEFRPPRDVESQIKDLTQDFATSFNTGNYDQAAALFASDAVLMAPLYESAHGQKAVELLLRQMGDAGYSHMKLETTRVDHSGEMAMELGRFTMTLLKPDGTVAVECGKFVKVWRRLGAWLIVADCWNRTSVTANDRAA